MSFLPNSEDVETAIAMWSQQNHIKFLMAIEKDMVSSAYSYYLPLLLKQEIREYLDTYGSELDPTDADNAAYLYDAKRLTPLGLHS